MLSLCQGWSSRDNLSHTQQARLLQDVKDVVDQGTTASGKRKRRHPTAEVKGNWTPKEDELLIKCATTLPS